MTRTTPAALLAAAVLALATLAAAPAAAPAAAGSAPALAAGALAPPPLAARGSRGFGTRPRSTNPRARAAQRARNRSVLGGILRVLGIAWLLSVLFGIGSGGSPLGLLLVGGFVLWLVLRGRRRRRPLAYGRL